MERLDGRLHLLVNNAGSAEGAAFAAGGYANVRRTMELNFDSVVRLTEALLPILRESAPSSIVNVSSVAGRVASPKQGAYSASKFALAGWTESLHLEEGRHGVHVGHVLPGFIATEGFPQSQLTGKALTRWIVSKPEKVAQAILDAGPGGRAERIVPRPYALVPVMRTLFPGLVRRGAARRA
jgi:short-subunit dehydrogenase